MLCQYCFSADMQIPANGHSAYVECPNCGAIELTYTAQDYQEPLHTVDYTYTRNKKTGKWERDIQIIGIFGGYGSGKSKSSLHEVFIRALENPGGTGLLTAPTLQLLKRTTLKTLFTEVIPPPLITRYNKSDGEIELINGFVFYTIPSDDEEKLRSINAGIVHIEEASGIKRTIYDQLVTRSRDKNVKNRAIFVCSNPDVGWIRDVIYLNDSRKDPGHPQHDDYVRQISCFVWPTELNQYLPPDYIEINSKGKPEWWINRYMKGSMDHSEGMVYPNFGRCQRDSTEYLARYGGQIPRSWERFATLDHGLTNPTAFYLHAINPDTGEVVTYDEHYEPGKLIPHHAPIIKARLDSIPPGKIRFMVADPSIRNKTDPINGKSVLALYAEYDVHFQPGNNSIEAGILRVSSYIERGKWVVFRDKCPNLCREMINYKWPELTMDSLDENRDERPEKKNDHGPDSIRYGFMRLPEDPDMLLNVAYSPPNKYTKNEKYAEDEFDEDEDVPSGDWLSYGY